MRCGYSESDIALYIEGDLSEEKACGLQAHLGHCPDCDDLVSSLRESQAVLKTLRQETVSSAVLSSVRTRVLAEISGSAPSRWGRWVYALAGTAFAFAICIAVVAQWRKAAPEPRQAPSIASPAAPAVPAAPAAVALRADGNTPAVTSEAPRPRRKRAVNGSKRPDPPHTDIPSEMPKQLVVKLLTDDPNVVIYWFVDQTGGTL